MVPTTNEQVMAKPDDVASNTDTGYETGSVASASSSSQISKVRHTVVAGVLNEGIIRLKFMNFLNVKILKIDQLTHHNLHAHKHTHTYIYSKLIRRLKFQTTLSLKSERSTAT